MFALPLRPVVAIIRAGLAFSLLALVACAERAPLKTGAEGQLFARGMHDIAGLYLQPVTSRHLALAGAARLSRLDSKLGVTDSFGSRFADSLTLSYDGRDIALFAAPPDNDNAKWGELLANIITTAKQASPRFAALPQETIETAVLDGMTGSLDRFSRYSDPQVARDQRAARDGFGGIGVTLDSIDNQYRVTAVAPQSPAARAGIRPEDQIVAINGVATAGCPHHDVVRRLRGPIGSAVAIRVLDPGTARPREVQLHRAYVILPSVTMSHDGDIAVFRITSFNRTTSQRVAAGMAQFQQQTGKPLGGVVLDLRGDPGGLLDQAVDLARLFIHDGPIVATIGRHPASRQYFAANGDSIAARIPVAVLINGGSASASEIVAAALQDVGRAVVIGSSSYGKGTVQTVMRLPNDGDLIVTWARLVTPTGYFLQAHGVVPTLCTADLGNGADALQTGLQQVAAAVPGAGLSFRPRAGLDERAWAELRHSCPPSHASPAVDLTLAERVLADPKLYSEAVHALPVVTQFAQNTPAGGERQPALTGVNRALSSRPR